MTTLSTNPATLHYDRSGSAGNDRSTGLDLSAWLGIAVIALLMVATFRFNLIRLWGKTNPITGEGEWTHALVVPFIGLYYLYINRDDLLKARIKPVLLGGFSATRWGGAMGLALMGVVVRFAAPALFPSQEATLQAGSSLLLALGVLVLLLNWGIAMTVFGLVFFGYGIWPGQNDYFKDLGMVCTLFGVVLTLCGWDVMKIAWFPIAFLICALPWPGLFYSWVAGPLQVLAAQVAVWVLQLGGVPGVYQAGTKIVLPTRALNVAEACAGLKSLMTFVTVAGAVAFLSSKPLWQKLLMVAAAVPIAIFCNVMRVSGQGLLDYYAGQEWSENFAHQFVGMVMLIPAFFMIMGLGWLLDQLFLEEVDEETERAVAVASGVTRDLSTVVAPAVAVAAAPVRPVASIPVQTVKANSAAAIAARSVDAPPSAPPAPPTPSSSPSVSPAVSAPVQAPVGIPVAAPLTLPPRQRIVPPATVMPAGATPAGSPSGPARRGFVPPGVSVSGPQSEPSPRQEQP